MTKQFSPLLLVIAAVWAQAAFSPADAQTVTILHDFQNGTVSGDGQFPGKIIQGRDGNFYGTTLYGGSTGTPGQAFSGSGTAFKMTPNGAVTILHNFGDGSVFPDGSLPGLLTQGSDGNFYGTTEEGGSTYSIDPNGVGYGTAYKMTPAGVVTILHNFGDGSVNNDAQTPNGLVQGRDGNFYGTSVHGGSAGLGTVYKMTPAGVITILHGFEDGSVRNDGTFALGLVQGTDGNFYGTTLNGGATGTPGQAFSGNGIAYKMTPTGAVTILHSFGDGTVHNDGKGPLFLIPDKDGNFYGTTSSGGSTVSADPNRLGYGTAFKMTLSGGVTILHSFGDGTVKNDGTGPGGLTLGTDGNFYSASGSGGSTVSADPSGYGYGTIFKMTPAGAITILHNFGDGTVKNDGTNGGGLVQGTDGNLYGTTTFGGSTATPGQSDSGSGTAYRLTLSGTAPAPVWTAHDVAASSDGTARMLWTRSDGAAGVWKMSASNIQAAVGPVYGPYPGWKAQDISVASDGTSRVLWTNTNGMAGVWTFNSAGTETAIGPTYGPYPGWTATDLAVAPNGTSRVLWTNTNGQAGVWTFNATGTETIIGKTYGPYSGWSAKAVGAAGDGTAHVLWTNVNGDAGVWTFNAADADTVIGATYGPYTGWNATDLSTSSDGTSKVLWKRSDGAAGVWTFSAADAETTMGAVNGPFAGYTAASMDSANDQSRVLWVNTSRVAGLWTFGTNDDESLIGPTYGPF